MRVPTELPQKEKRWRRPRKGPPPKGPRGRGTILRRNGWGAPAEGPPPKVKKDDGDGDGEEEQEEEGGKELPKDVKTVAWKPALAITTIVFTSPGQRA